MATKRKRKYLDRKLRRFDIDDLAKDFLDVKTVNDVYDNVEWSDDEEESKAWRNYIDAIEYVSENLCRELGLMMVGNVRYKGTPKEYTAYYTFRPKRSWVHVAKQFIEVINGHGMFGFTSVGEAVRMSSVLTPKQFVYCHMHWAKVWFQVYEGVKDVQFLVDRRARSR